MSVARAYAKALYEATPAAERAQTSTQLLEFKNILDQCKPLETVLLGPLASLKEKTGFLNELGKRAAFSKLFQNFLLLLVNKGRLDLFVDIIDAFEGVSLEEQGGLSGTLISATPIEPAQVDALAAAFGKKLSKKIQFKTLVDASLIAGIKVTVNGVTYDGTLRSKLKRLRDRFVFGTTTAH